MKTRSSYVSMILCLATLAVARNASAKQLEPSPPELSGALADPLGRPTALELVRSAPFKVVAEPAGVPRLIVIGENHAKVSAQEHLITLLESLHAAGRLEVVLIEGSAGPVDVRGVSAAIGDVPADFWRNEVREGRLDGVEYFSLTHVNVPLIGVEDMRAKARFLAVADAKLEKAYREAIAKATSEAYAKLAAKLSETENTTITAQLGRLRDAMQSSDTEAATFDAFAITANMLLDHAGKHGIDLPEVDGFFAVWRNTGFQELARGLDERDRALVANSLQHLGSDPDKVAVLITGCAHLRGIAKYLQQHQIAFVSGCLNTSLYSTDQWEIRALVRRQPGGSGAFAEAEWTRTKPKTQLLDPSFVTTRKAVEKLFESIDSGRLVPTHMQGEAKFFPISVQSDVVISPNSGFVRPRSAQFPPVSVRSDELIARIGGVGYSREINFGSHFVGRMRGRNGNYLEVWDRTAAKRAVRSLSNADVQFVFVHQRAARGKSEYVIHSTAGEQSFAEFSGGAPPGKQPRHVIFFMEPDDIPESGGRLSPFHRRVTDPPKPPPGKDGEGWLGRMSNEGCVETLDPSRRVAKSPRVVFTNNPERSGGNLKALRKQDPRLFGDIQLIDTTTKGLSALRFTPSRGDHAQVTVIVAENTPKFRTEMRRAAEARKLTNKQVILLTCGDAHAEMHVLRELLLDNGALMVWTPGKKIDPDAARAFARALADAVNQGSVSPDQRADIGALIETMRARWEAAPPPGVDLNVLNGSSTWTRTLPPAEDRQASPNVHSVTPRLQNASTRREAAKRARMRLS